MRGDESVGMKCFHLLVLGSLWGGGACPGLVTPYQDLLSWCGIGLVSLGLLPDGPCLEILSSSQGELLCSAYCSSEGPMETGTLDFRSAQKLIENVLRSSRVVWLEHMVTTGGRMLCWGHAI